jgi:hypothetical protein
MAEKPNVNRSEIMHQAELKCYRWIDIRRNNLEMFKGKPCYRVYNKKSGAQLAILSWYEPWKCYVFSSHDGCVFNDSCLRDVVDFLACLKS